MRSKTAHKSFRTLVGSCGPDSRFGQGVYIYDTNASDLDFGLFALFNECSPEAERAGMEYLSEKATPYVDSSDVGSISKPQAFVRDIVIGLQRELETAGLVEHQSTRHSFAVALVKHGQLHIARINACPLFYLKDRKLFQVFKTPEQRGLKSVQAESVSAGSGDCLAMCSENMIKHMSRLELKNMLLTEPDLNLACGKLQMTANRYEETVDPRMLLVKFEENERRNSTAANMRNFGIVAALAVVIMIPFLWGDIMRAVRANTLGYVKKQKTLVERAIEKIQPDAKKYLPEIALDGLRVPYDIDISDDGIYYIVDVGRDQVIRHDPATGDSSYIGEKTKLRFPTGIDVSEDKLYVADFSINVNRVFAIGMDGEPAGEMPSKRGRITMRNPKAIAVAKDLIYVCDRGNNRVLVFDKSGSHQRTIDIPRNYREPNGIAIADSGDIFVTLKLSGTVLKIVGKEITPFTLFEEKDGENTRISLNKPSGIAVDSQGFVYIADTAAKRALIANPMGKIAGIIAQDSLDDLQSFYPMSVKLDPKGQYLYIVGSNRYSYDAGCENVCKGKIWRVKL